MSNARADYGNLRQISSATRWALLAPLWALVLPLGWRFVDGLARFGPTTFVVAIGYAGQAATATVLAARYLGHADADWSRVARMLKVLILALSTVELLLLSLHVTPGPLTGLNSYTAYVLAVLPTAAAWAVADWRITSSLAVVSCLAATTHPDPMGAAGAIAGTWLLVVLVVRAFQSSVDIMHRLDLAHRTEARLAVAEERLRFARDLHDTVSRTLAVIALKSELGARLTGNATARAEMDDVQQLARTSQAELREVVSGYRAPNLTTELNGARAVLTAAGITCRINDDQPSERAGGQDSVLGWVVREGTTNVIRHSRATYCTITVTRDDEGAAVRIVNDGVLAAPETDAGSTSGPGCGMVGLAQRLSAHGGTLVHGHGADQTYQLTAHLPRHQEPS